MEKAKFAIADRSEVYAAGLSVVLLEGLDLERDRPRVVVEWARQRGRRLGIVVIRQEGDWETLRLLSTVRQRKADLRVVAALAEPTLVAIDRAISRSVSGVVGCDDDQARIVEVVSAALKGDVLLAEQTVHELHLLRSRVEAAPTALDAQEVEVLMGLSRDESASDIARRTSGGSRKHVEHIVERVGRRVGGRGRVSTLCLAVYYGLISPPKLDSS